MHLEEFDLQIIIPYRVRTWKNSQNTCIVLTFINSYGCSLLMKHNYSLGWCVIPSARVGGHVALIIPIYSSVSMPGRQLP